MQESEKDVLMEDIIFHEAYFQFGDDEPIKFAYIPDGELSIVLRAVDISNPEVVFDNGSGKIFKIFLKPEKIDEQTIL